MRSESTGASSQSVIWTPQYSLAPVRYVSRIVLCLPSGSIRYRRIGRSRSIHELRSITVGTITLNGTLCARSRTRASEASAPGATFGGWRFGVLSTGASASVPWNVWPTITVSIAPFESALITALTGFTSAVPKRVATFFAAAAAPAWDLS